MNHLLFGIPIGIVVFLIPGLPLLGALLNGFIALHCRSGRAPIPKGLVNLIGVGMPFLAFILVLFFFPFAWHPASGLITPPLWDWISVGDLTAGFSFRVDRLSLLMSLVVTGVGTLIHLYSTGYMKDDAGLARYFAYLNLFLFAMLLLVLAANLPLLFVGWEGVGLCSYLLIGFWFSDPEKAAAGRKAFILNRIGDFGFLLGMFFIYHQLSSKGVDPVGGLLSFDVMEKYKGELFFIATPVALLLLLGATGKSAQIPLYVWLPDAMAGPTPVSALIHAATMVTAGIYLMARMHFLYILSPLAMQIVATVGMATAFIAALMALAQNDIKKVLAYSTISQLGTMFFAIGIGAFAAAIFHLITHAFFKACLFLGAGSVIHGMGGEQDIWKMGGLRKKMPVTSLTFALGFLALTGIFPFAGFFSKDTILWQGFALGHTGLWAVGFVTAGLSAAYMARLYALVFLGKPRASENFYHAHESPLSMTFPLVVLGILSVIGGWMGIPESMMGHDNFFRWLAPIFPYEKFLMMIESKGHGLELLLSIVTLLWVGHIALITVLLYSQKQSLIPRLTRLTKPLQKLTLKKFYVDEVYNFLLVKPLVWISEKILWKFSDEKVIDSLLVEGTAETVGLMGQTLSILQSGVLQTYALLFATGALLVMALFIL